MPIAKKIFPFGVSIDPRNCFKLLILSEGFTENEERFFHDACTDLVESLLNTTPFNYLRIAPFWLQVYSYFAPSDHSGPAIDSSATLNRTVFESSLDSSTNNLSFNVQKINDLIDQLNIRGNDGQELALHQLMHKNFFPNAITGTLIIVLLPATNQPEGGEYEHVPSETDYYFVATTLNQNWWQVPIRGIGRMAGLGDEFEFDGADFLEPDEDQSQLIPFAFFNLVYFKTPPSGPLDFTFRWFGLLSSTQQLSPLPVHLHPEPNSVADRYLQPVPTTYESIELWEGGGGYRKKIYRAAMDCLMRRKIGDPSLPVRQKLIPFCKTCEYFFKSLIE